MAQLYKKTGTCSRPSGAQTDYPMYLVVGESAGSRKAPVYPPAHSDTYVKATSKISTQYQPYYATDPSKSLTGSLVGTEWISSSATNQRFHVDLGSGKVITQIYYENSHSSGTSMDAGAKNFTLWGSNESTAFAELTYGTDTDWTQIGGALQFDQHTASNVADPKYISVTNTTSYRYYALKIADNWGYGSYIGLRHIVLLTEDVFVHCSGHCKSDFGDIRFFDGSDNALGYMIDWGSLTGTTPNQSVGVWVAPSPGTSATDVVIKYGDATLTDASTSTIFTRYDGAERGSDGDAVGGDWTVAGGSVKITTDVAYVGTRSIEFTGNLGKGTIPVTASANIAIQFRARKVDAEGMTLQHGDGTKRSFFKWDTDENIYPHTSAETYGASIGVASKDAWHKFEFNNFDWTANTWDLWLDDVQIGDGLSQSNHDPASDNVFYASNRVNVGAVYIDEFIVRKYASPEPTWGTWGAEVEIGSTPTGPSGIKALGPTASASIKAYGPTAWGSVKAL